MRSDHPSFNWVVERAALINALAECDEKEETVLHYIARESDEKEARRKITAVLDIHRLKACHFDPADKYAENERGQTALAVAMEYHPDSIALHQLLSDCEKIDGSCKMYRQAIEVNSNRKSVD